MKKLIVLLMIICLAACGCSKEEQNAEYEKAKEKYKWVEESHKETTELLNNLDKKMEDIKADPIKYAAEHNDDKKDKPETDSEVYANVKVALNVCLLMYSDEINITEETYVKVTKDGVKTDNEVLANKLKEELGDLSKVKMQVEHSFKISPSSDGFTILDK